MPPDTWRGQWRLVTLDPARAFSAERTVGRAFRFFLANHLLAAVLMAAATGAFVFDLHRRSAARAADDLSVSVPAALLIYLAYVLVQAALTLTSAGVAWLAGRAFGSTLTWPRQLAAMLDLSAFEPLSIVPCGLVVLLLFEWNAGAWSRALGIGTLVAARGWTAWSARWAVRSPRPLPRWKQRLVYVVGILVLQVVAPVLCLLFVWVSIGMALIPGWD